MAMRGDSKLLWVVLRSGRSHFLLRWPSVYLLVVGVLRVRRALLGLHLEYLDLTVFAILEISLLSVDYEVIPTPRLTLLTFIPLLT